MYREGAQIPPLFQAAAGGVVAGNYVSGWLIVTPTAIRFSPVTGKGWDLDIRWVLKVLPCSIASVSTNGIRIETWGRAPHQELLVANPLEAASVIGAILEQR